MQQDRRPLYEGFKRLFDLVMGSALLLIFSPLLLGIALLIKRRSPGPVFFRQVRVGRGDRLFLIYKFRTMTVDADQNGPQITSSDDSRVTPLGRFLRNTKLDELPQLINVVKGDMSLVGPRPQVPRFVDEFRPDHRSIVLAVRPGITGPTQLTFRHEERLLEGQPDPEQYYIERLLPIKCAMDAEYVRQRCWSYDLRVLGKTAFLFLRSWLRRLRRKESEPAYTEAIVTALQDVVEDRANVAKAEDAAVTKR